MKILITLLIAMSWHLSGATSWQLSEALEVGSEYMADLQEQDLNFVWFSNEDSYSCSYAEQQAQKYLRALGAQDIRMKCFGGIDFSTPMWTWGSLTLKAQFSAYKVFDGAKTPVTYQNVAFNGRDSCAFNLSLLKGVLEKVDHLEVTMLSFCRGNKGSFRAEVQVLK